EFFGGGFDYLFFCGIENSFHIKIHEVSPGGMEYITECSDSGAAPTSEKMKNRRIWGIFTIG
ncbi:MAG TPA: hypothetical protein VMV59_00630, partial [Candidatus Dormibacteraeota bacterium]|nr:hypothetical protein [Candidatus Dormibacteraeota bacterium]